MTPPWPRAVPKSSLQTSLEEGLSSSVPVPPQQDLGPLCLPSAPSPAIHHPGDQDQPLHLTSKPPGGTRGARATVAAPPQDCLNLSQGQGGVAAGGDRLSTSAEQPFADVSAWALWHPRWWRSVTAQADRVSSSVTTVVPTCAAWADGGAKTVISGTEAPGWTDETLVASL